MWYFQFSIQENLERDFRTGRLRDLSATITRFRNALPEMAEQVIVECDAQDFCVGGIEIIHQIKTHASLGTSPLHIRLSMPLEDANARLAQLSALAIMTQLRDLAHREHLMGFHFDGILAIQFSYSLDDWKRNQRSNGGRDTSRQLFAPRAEIP